MRGLGGGSGGGSSGATSRALLVFLFLSLTLNFYMIFRDAVDSRAVQTELYLCRKRSKVQLYGSGNVCPEAPQCPKCPVLDKPCPEVRDGGDGAEATTPTDANDNADPVIEVGGPVADPNLPPEEGWKFGLERKASRTDNTIYDPSQDAALTSKSLSRYARSPVPKGSWRVRVGRDKWVTMDEVCFAYDVWFEENQVFQYASWMGVFVQQDPMDAFAIQDMLWRVKPDLIIEIGTNTGGGAIFYATIMKAYNPSGKIVTLDVKEVSNWNKRNNERCEGCVLATQHAWWNDGMITFIKGRVTEKATRDQIDPFVAKAKTVLVIEDASHRYPDTLENINAVYHYVTVGSYLLVQDTKMDRFVAGLGKKYGRLRFGPMRSVDEFVAKHPNFVIDRRFEYFLYSQHHRGFLRRTS